MEGIDIKTITEGGAVGISVLLIILIYIIMRNNNKLFTRALDNNTSVIRECMQIIGSTKEAIHQNSKILQRVEHKLDRYEKN